MVEAVEGPGVRGARPSNVGRRIESRRFGFRLRRRPTTTTTVERGRVRASGERTSRRARRRARRFGSINGSGTRLRRSTKPKGSRRRRCSTDVIGTAAPPIDDVEADFNGALFFCSGRGRSVRVGSGRVGSDIEPGSRLKEPIPKGHLGRPRRRGKIFRY